MTHEVVGAALRRVNELRRTLGLPELEKLPRGRKGSPSSCPVARAFSPHKARFDAGILRIYKRQVVWKLMYESELVAFTIRFDGGGFPELELRWWER